MKSKEFPEGFDPAPAQEDQQRGPDMSRRGLLKLLGGFGAAALTQLSGHESASELPPIPDFELSPKNRLQLAGTAGCHYQDDPDSTHHSEWAYERDRSKAGLSDKIAGPFDSDKQPHFYDHPGKILKQAASLGNSYRTSFDFAELCPEKGVFNEELMATYVQMLARCHSLGVEPLITLHHWPMPKSFATYDANGDIQKGPLEHPGIVDHFAFYVDKVAEFLFDPDKIRNALKGEGYDQEFLERICDEKTICRWFISINEPVNLIFNAYITGYFPPYQKLSLLKRGKLMQKIRDMHRIAHHGLHDKALTKNQQTGDSLKVGMSHHVINSKPLIYSDLAGWGFVEEMEQGPREFLGLQYYFRLKFAYALSSFQGNDPRSISDNPLCPQIYPAGVYDIMKYASGKWPGRELLLSEYGFTDKDDNKRPFWTLESLGHLIRARQEGANVTGALCWPLSSTTEWRLGMTIPNSLVDQNGDPMSWDKDPLHSTEVLRRANDHLVNPTPAKAAELRRLRDATWKQLEESVARK